MVSFCTKEDKTHILESGYCYFCKERNAKQPSNVPLGEYPGLKGLKIFLFI